jgi:hypothetical protein
MPADFNQRAMHNFGIVQKITDKNGQIHAAMKWGRAYHIVYPNNSYIS